MQCYLRISFSCQNYDLRICFRLCKSIDFLLKRIASGNVLNINTFENLIILVYSITDNMKNHRYFDALCMHMLRYFIHKKRCYTSLCYTSFDMLISWKMHITAVYIMIDVDFIIKWASKIGLWHSLNFNPRWGNFLLHAECN